MDWSHALLTEPERVLFRRVAVFMGGFDLDAAQAVCGDSDVERYQILDQLTLLIEKSLVVAEDGDLGTRYRMLETVRQYALEKLGESGEADAVRARHRDHYAAAAALLDAPGPHRTTSAGSSSAETEMDNLRAAFTWCRESADTATALQLASALQPLWTRSRPRAGGHGLVRPPRFADAAAGHAEVPPAARARALADQGRARGRAEHPRRRRLRPLEAPCAIARETRRPGACWCGRSLACGAHRRLRRRGCASSYFAEALGLARAVGDDRSLSQILAFPCVTRRSPGKATGWRRGRPGKKGRDVADAIGDGYSSRGCRWCVALAHWLRKAISPSATARSRELVAESEAAHDEMWRVASLVSLGHLLAYVRSTRAGARAAATAAVDGRRGPR